MNVLETERLALTPITEKDLKFLLALRWNKQICEWIIHEPLSESDQLAWFKSPKNAAIFVIHLKSGEPIGTIGLTDISTRHQRAKWNLRIHPDYWRQGYAKEIIPCFLEYIFETLNINKLTGDCFVENIAEVNNLRKLGFEEEGIWKEHYYHKGKFRDSIQTSQFRPYLIRTYAVALSPLPHQWERVRAAVRVSACKRKSN